MDFNQLDESIKKQYHEEITECSEILGGTNFFLNMIEEIKQEKPTPLLNKSGSFHTSKAKLTLSKALYKETYSLLFDAMRREEKTGDMLNGISPKEYKNVMNMMRALSSVTITIESKENEEARPMTFKILDTTTDKKTKITFMFKVIFFYHIEEAKKALNYN